MWDNAGALKRVTGWLMILVVLILLGALVVWVYNSPYFPVKQVKIEGDVQRTGNKQLQSVAQQYIRGNIFKADLNGAQEAFAKLPWIDKVSVRRRLPDTVEINLKERVPVGRWKESGLIDSNGNLFNAATDEAFPLFEGQPGTGAIMVKHYNEFTAILKPKNLSIAKLEYTPRSAWSVELNNGISVRLGRENETKRLQRFADMWQEVLQVRQSNIDYVDMRYKDGFAVRYLEKTQEQETAGPSETAIPEAETANRQ
ncbi:cell division protein FtsQ/DivIB [Neisseria dumasiana]|uniref:cell division protein FtsQ/DivIB n=1 Tax=Neisseria dumasiana TaxID=1931275 RepID=UPI000A18BECA|nr:cell division protein FtsQ/DivIB [Neisseria dumasiana]OSI17331.1 cell division protein FtsQ [Neisseria dumasiana]